MVLRCYCIVLMFKTRSFDRIIRLSPRESEKNVLSSRPQNSRFFSQKSVKKSVKRDVRVLSARRVVSRARKASEEREKKNLALPLLLCEM